MDTFAHVSLIETLTGPFATELCYTTLHADNYLWHTLHALDRECDTHRMVISLYMVFSLSTHIFTRNFRGRALLGYLTSHLGHDICAPRKIFYRAPLSSSPVLLWFAACAHAHRTALRCHLSLSWVSFTCCFSRARISRFLSFHSLFSAHTHSLAPLMFAAAHVLSHTAFGLRCGISLLCHSGYTLRRVLDLSAFSLLLLLSVACTRRSLHAPRISLCALLGMVYIALSLMHT